MLPRPDTRPLNRRPANNKICERLFHRFERFETLLRGVERLLRGGSLLPIQKAFGGHQLLFGVRDFQTAVAAKRESEFLGFRLTASEEFFQRLFISGDLFVPLAVPPAILRRFNSADPDDPRIKSRMFSSLRALAKSSDFEI
jgi:hypothetical protein